MWACEMLRVAADKPDADAAASSVAGAATQHAASAASVPRVVTNTKSYQARLGLARVLSRQKADLSEVKKWYIEAIDMADNVSLTESLYILVILPVSWLVCQCLKTSHFHF